MIIEQEDKRYQKENTQRSTHRRKKKNLLIFLQKCEKADTKNTLVEKWELSHETIGIKEIKTRVC